MMIPLALLLLAFLVVVAVERVSDAVRRPAEVAALPVPRWRPTAVVVRRSDRASILALGWAEGVRMLGHPVTLAGLLVVVVFTGVVRPTGVAEPFFVLTGGGPGGMWLPVLVLFAANLCATRTRRSRAAELLGAAPVDQQRRTAALCVGALVPAGATLVYVLLAYASFVVFDDVHLAPTPTVAELLLLPLAVLGAGTLGVMVARWAPWRGSMLVVFVAIVALSLWVSTRWPLLASYVHLVEWDSTERIPGSTTWHAGYLLGLDAMAAVGAVLRDTTRRRALLGAGAVVTLATIGAGWAQLP